MDNTFKFVNSLTFQVIFTSTLFFNFAKNCFEAETKHKFTLEEFIVLDTIVCYPHIDKNTLSKSLLKDNISIAQTLSSLIKNKWIKKIERNNREICLKYFDLTSEGERIYKDCAPAYDMMLNILVRFITEQELASFTKTLLKIRNILISLSDSENFSNI